jgi:hypothetical protein
MRKISDDYSAESAREELNELFTDHPAIQASIDDMSNTTVCVLAVMMAGNSVTTAGYTIDADYGVKRASAVIHSIEQHLFPVSSRRVETESDVGNKTHQSLFFISKEDLEHLKTAPDDVFNRCREQASVKKMQREQQDMRRLLKELGTDGVRKLLYQVANDSDPDKNVS